MHLLLHPQVTSYDRMGYLHDLVNALFECDLACAKAHITTSPSNGVLDVFWICDYTKVPTAPPLSFFQGNCRASLLCFAASGHQGQGVDNMLKLTRASLTPLHCRCV